MNGITPVSKAFGLGCFFLICALSCARQGAPAGGPRDVAPPMVDTTTSTRNFSTRFNQQRIQLKFNEWVTLSDQATQVIVSPPLAKKPDISLHGKMVQFEFDKTEQLRPNTTYTINFGTSVKDFHEGNVARDLRFVFSTGDYIDSVGFKGQLNDAFTGDPVENVSIVLYDVFSDSTIIKERPYYFARTDKTGQYTFSNLRADTFLMAAFEDADQNLRWSGEGERVAFLDTLLDVRNGMKTQGRLSLFKNRPKFRVSTPGSNRFGLLRLAFNTPVDSFTLQTIGEVQPVFWPEKMTDSLLLWYDMPLDTNWTLVFNSLVPARQSDTIQVKKASKADFLKGHRLGFAGLAPAPAPARGKAIATPKAQPAKTFSIPQSQPALLAFNYPVAAYDTALWMLMLDSLPQRAFSVDIRSPRQLSLQTAWLHGRNYTLLLLPSALTDIWGASNTDTLHCTFTILGEKQLGTLSLNVEKLKPGAPYVIELLNGNTLENTQRFTATEAMRKFTYKDLPVATYTIRLIEDANNNGRWDTGDVLRKQQPEKIFSKKLEALRGNWELEAAMAAEILDAPDPKDKKKQ